MKSPADNILVLTPYTKRLGIAIFRQRELRYFAVKSFRAPRSILSIQKETHLHLLNLIREFPPKMVIVKKITNQQAISSNHQRVVDAIRQVADYHTLLVKEIPFETVRRKIVTKHKPTVTNVATILQRSYPELGRYAQAQNRWQREYFAPILSAVAIGHFHSNRYSAPSR
jgi:hypothetical protein